MENNVFTDQLRRLYPKGSVVAVVCNQFGDTGKGAIVDRFMSIADICVRAGGGDNCGHTIEANGHKYVTHIIPSGIIYDELGLTSVIAHGVAFNPLTAQLELEEFSKAGISHNNLKISFRAKLIMPHNIFFDMLSASLANKSKRIGTTGRGIGPVFNDFVSRIGLRVSDMLDYVVMRDKLNLIMRDKIAFLHSLDRDMLKEILNNERLEKGRFYNPKSILDVDKIVERYLELGTYFKDYICDAEAYIKSRLGKDTIIFEGSQGALLDINLGTYPYVTSTQCTAAGFVSGANLRAQDITKTLGTVKAYMTRVGEGPFPTEIGCYDAVSRYQEISEEFSTVPIIEKMNSKNQIIQAGSIGVIGNEFGATTGRPRRIGWIDLVALRYAIDINGSDIAITKLDVLTGLKKLKLCVSYRYVGHDVTYIPLSNNEYLDRFIPEADILKHCQPVYEEMQGWEEDISQVRAWSDLPQAAKNYLLRIEELAHANIIMIGVGAHRDSMFFK